MAITSWLSRRRLRRSWGGAILLALVVSAGGAATLIAVGASERTAEAYASYRERAHVGDLVINPSMATEDSDALIRSLPGATAVASDALLLGWLGAGDDESETIQVRGSGDGRYGAVDRPTVRDGRLPTGRNEVLIDVDVARRKDLSVGDEVDLSFGDPRSEFTIGPGAPPPVLGTEHLEVVGIATLPDQVLPESLYPRGTVIVSADIAQRYDCLAGVPDDDATWQEAINVLLPEGCAMQYRYYSLELDGGTAGVPAALAAYAEGIETLNATFPDLTDDPEYPLDSNLGYFQITTVTHDEQVRVERSIRPSVVSLAVLGLAAGIVTLTVASLAAAREVRRSEDEQRVWRAMGMTSGERSLVVALPLVGAAAVGLIIATVAAWLFSSVAPVGIVRVVEPAPGRELSWTSWAGLGLLAVGSVACIAVLSMRSARRSIGEGREVHVARATVVRATRPEVAEGLGAAFGRGRGSLAAVAIGVVVIALALTTVIFGSSLGALVSTPTSYGWSWDAAVVFNYGYGGVDLAAATEALDRRPDIEGWSALAFVTPVSLDGDPAPGVAALTRTTRFEPAIVKEHAPAGPDEIALGARTAADRGLGVGDPVEVSADGIGPRRATVTGIVVLPALGPFQSDRTGPGTGVLLPEAVLDPQQLDGSATFVGLDLAADADPGRVLADLRGDLAAWATNGFPPSTYRSAVQPPEIIDARSMRTLPTVVGVLLVGAATIGLSMSLAVSVRARRRDLAVLRALGFTRQQVRRSIQVQAVATIAAALVITVPLGVVLGRWTWNAFAVQLGVLPDPSIPALGLVIAVAVPMVIAFSSAIAPVRRAPRGRLPPPSCDRSERESVRPSSVGSDPGARVGGGP